MVLASSTPTVFICGITGCQGGALAYHLRKLGWAVRSTARDLASPEAHLLAAAGVQLTLGVWDNSAALKTAMAGCDKLFLCSLLDWKDMDREPRQARHIVKIAKDAGISQVLGSTSMGVFTLEEAKAENLASDSFMTRHLINKKHVELAIQKGGFRHWTNFASVVLHGQFSRAESGTLSRAQGERYLNDGNATGHKARSDRPR